jgi:hypothetical protein
MLFSYQKNDKVFKNRTYFELLPKPWLSVKHRIGFEMLLFASYVSIIASHHNAHFQLTSQNNPQKYSGSCSETMHSSYFCCFAFDCQFLSFVVWITGWAYGLGCLASVVLLYLRNLIITTVKC